MIKVNYDLSGFSDSVPTITAISKDDDISNTKDLSINVGQNSIEPTVEIIEIVEIVMDSEKSDICNEKNDKTDKRLQFLSICNIACTPNKIPLPGNWIQQVIVNNMECLMWTEYTNGYSEISKRILLLPDMSVQVSLAIRI